MNATIRLGTRGSPLALYQARLVQERLAKAHGLDPAQIVIDVIRMNKGHTEGLEPKITEEIIKSMLRAKGGKLQGN